MNFKYLASGISCLALLSVGCQESGAKGSASSAVTSLTTTKDSVSYAIGNDISRSLGNIKDEFNMEVLIKALKDNMAGKDLLLTPENSQALMQNFSKSMQEKQQKKTEEATKKNKEEGEKFLAENKAKEGIKTTESGLQYSVITEGKGPKPTLTDKVSVHYKGTLIDGTEFDSSIKRGKPASFPVTGVIKGWTEALQLMNTGSKYKLFIPSDLAYGPRGSGQQIGPNATLIFEVELLSIDTEKKADVKKTDAKKK